MDALTKRKSAIRANVAANEPYVREPGTGPMMTPISDQLPQPGSRVNDIIVSVLCVSVLVLVGIISITQFAYY